MKKALGKLRKRFNSIDNFGSFFKFNLPENETTLTTSSGALLTIFMWTLIIMYGSV